MTHKLQKKPSKDIHKKQSNTANLCIQLKLFTNQNKNLISFIKSKENIHKNEDRPDCTVSNKL